MKVRQFNHWTSMSRKGTGGVGGMINYVHRYYKHAGNDYQF